MSCNCDYVVPNKESLAPHYDNCRLMWDELHPGKPCPKNADGTIMLPNKHLAGLDVDILYHLGLDTKTYDLPAMFGDVKFVCMGGTKVRMREFAEYMREVLDLPNKGERLVNLTKHSQRYAMYKVGPVLSVSHGIGIPSMTTVLQEVIKLMSYAKAKDPIFFRIGTSGGLSIPAGSVVVSSFGLNGNLEQTYDIPILGKTRKLPALLDQRVYQEVHSLSSADDGFGTYIGGTMGADDFYRGQGRLDGPFCDYTEADKMAFLRSLTGMGVRNIEMEAPAFSAYTREAGIRACIVCITFLDRLQGDQVRCAAYRWRCFKVFNVLGMFGRWRVSCEFAILIILFF
ncbi:uridine phosphorylase 1 [Spodoptera frugiperda]|uniref:Uridine phosphorylase 1 n=1 Tax=Spodoptera frugiperda TaxID=7108 RepID=A0A9R0EXU1_SPOFR|nr:uridine phosphorylase 1 [Spodoptera frugiperda]